MEAGLIGVIVLSPNPFPLCRLIIFPRSPIVIPSCHPLALPYPSLNLPSCPSPNTLLTLLLMSSPISSDPNVALGSTFVIAVVGYRDRNDFEITATISDPPKIDFLVPSTSALLKRELTVTRGKYTYHGVKIDPRQRGEIVVAVTATSSSSSSSSNAGTSTNTPVPYRTPYYAPINNPLSTQSLMSTQIKTP